LLGLASSPTNARIISSDVAIFTLERQIVEDKGSKRIAFGSARYSPDAYGVNVTHPGN
jgi:hypothetical protein